MSQENNNLFLIHWQVAYGWTQSFINKKKKENVNCDLSYKKFSTIHSFIYISKYGRTAMLYVMEKLLLMQKVWLRKNQNLGMHECECGSCGACIV